MLYGYDFTTDIWNRTFYRMGHNLIEELHRSRQQCRCFEQQVKALETELETGNRHIEQLEAENQ